MTSSKQQVANCDWSKLSFFNIASFTVNLTSFNFCSFRYCMSRCLELGPREFGTEWLEWASCWTSRDTTFTRCNSTIIVLMWMRVIKNTWHHFSICMGSLPHSTSFRLLLWSMFSMVIGRKFARTAKFTLTTNLLSVTDETFTWI